MLRSSIWTCFVLPGLAQNTPMLARHFFQLCSNQVCSYFRMLSRTITLNSGSKSCAITHFLAWNICTSLSSLKHRVRWSNCIFFSLIITFTLHFAHCNNSTTSMCIEIFNSAFNNLFWGYMGLLEHHRTISSVLYVLQNKVMGFLHLSRPPLPRMML